MKNSILNSFYSLLYGLDELNPDHEFKLFNRECPFIGDKKARFTGKKINNSYSSSPERNRKEEAL